MLANVQEIKNEVRKYIKENFIFGLSDAEIQDNTSFLKIGVLDSTGIMELVAFLERQFKISVLDEEIVPENLDSIEGITEFLVGKIH